MDNSVVRETRGVLREIGGAGAVTKLTRLPPGVSLDDHVHDNPYLSLHVLGAYSEASEAGEVVIDGPAAAFHPAGSAHADRIGARGLATVVVEFDPAWLARALDGGLLPDRSVYWRSGAVAADSARLARLCLGPEATDRSSGAALRFLRRALARPNAPEGGDWLQRLEAILEADPDPEPADLGRRLGVSEAWLARAYRTRRGESLAERRRRRRVEAAVLLLEAGVMSLADVALEAGFCDQSHMNRSFQKVLGETPAGVRREWAGAA